MLYESDSSTHEATETATVRPHDAVDADDDGLLPTAVASTSFQKSQSEVFTIQMPEASTSFHEQRSKRSSGYVSLSGDERVFHVGGQESSDDEDGGGGDANGNSGPGVDTDAGIVVEELGSSTLHGACSRSSSKSNITIFKINTTNKLRQINKRKSRRMRAVRRSDSDFDDDDDDFDDDDLTLTSSYSRPRLAVGYDPSGGSGFLSVWSTYYSELMYEHDGVSWNCCVAFIIAFCSSAQCRAYTTALKMAAWFTTLVLVLLCLRRDFYGTAFHGYRYEPAARSRSRDTFMDLLHSGSYYDYRDLEIVRPSDLQG